MPEGPAVPLVCRAAERMLLASIRSNITRWTGGASEQPVGKTSGGQAVLVGVLTSGHQERFVSRGRCH